MSWGNVTVFQLRMYTQKYSVLGSFSIWSLQMEMTLDELMFGGDAEKEIKKPEIAVPCM